MRAIPYVLGKVEEELKEKSGSNASDLVEQGVLGRG